MFIVLFLISLSSSIIFEKIIIIPREMSSIYIEEKQHSQDSLFIRLLVEKEGYSVRALSNPPNVAFIRNRRCRHISPIARHYTSLGINVFARKGKINRYC